MAERRDQETARHFPGPVVVDGAILDQDRVAEVIHYHRSVRGRADYYFLPAFLRPATVFFLPLRVRALVCVRWPCTGSPRRCLMPW